MALVFNVLLDILLAGALSLFALAILQLALTTADSSERILRIAALAVGAMVALGAQVAGVPYASFAVDALASTRPASAAAKVTASIVPALIGAGLGYFIVRVYRRSETIAMRIMCFIGMLAVTAFIGIFAAATQTNGVILGAAALPNVSFVVGIILCIILTHEPGAPGPHFSVRVRGSIGRSRKVQFPARRAELTIATSSLQPADPPGTEPQKQPTRHDPFAQ